MTEQKRQQILKEFGYPPHIPCGECCAYQVYGDGDPIVDAQVINYCNNCDYYKEVAYGLNLVRNGNTDD